MSTVIKKGLLGKQDIFWYTSASPTFSRTTSSGGATNIVSVGATLIPVTTAAASFQFSVNNVNRAVNELGARARTASVRFVTMGASWVSNAASHKSAAATTANLTSCAATERISTPFFYRMNKPQLSYALYGATYVVSCPASTDAPAEVYINGRIYSNTGTTLCDLSRTKTPATATVGGLDRGPATATKAYYIYGVPSQNPTATRQWDMVASATHNTLTASATYPTWSWLGAVSLGSPVAVLKFTQERDLVSIGGKTTDRRIVSVAPPAQFLATWRNAFSSNIPSGISGVDLQVEGYVSAGVSNIGGAVAVNHADDLTATGATARYITIKDTPGGALGAGVSVAHQGFAYARTRTNGKYIGYRWGYVNAASATRSGYTVILSGFGMNRALYK
jgi:hypothetical protein